MQGESTALRHHPQENVLVEYSTGTLHQAGSVLIATHLAICPTCRAEVETLDAVGGALLSKIEPAEIADGLLDRVLSHIDETPETDANSAGTTPSTQASVIPRPLRDFIGDDLNSLNWVEDRPGIDRVDLPFGTDCIQAALFRVRGGGSVPQHTHSGNELVLILAGELTDDDGSYRPGDVAQADESVTHAPFVPCSDSCICLAIIEGGLDLDG